MGLVPPEACEYWAEAEQAMVKSIAVAPLSNGTRGWYFSGAEGEMRSYNSPIPTSLRVYE